MTTGEPWERIGVDVTGPHPKSRNGFVYILTYIDYFSKWCDAFPMRNQEASTVAALLVDKVFSYFGTPLQILTDQGRNFESELFQEMSRMLRIDHIRTTAYKPSTNGMVERFHRTLNSMIAKVVSNNQRDWDQWLPSVVAAYRGTVHESTGFSPNFLFLGRETYAPLDLLLGAPSPVAQSRSYNEFVAERQTRIRAAYDLVRDQLRTSANCMKRYYDMRVRTHSFKTGDWVWMYHPRRRVGLSPKWQKFYTGPFLVVCQLGPVNYRIQKSKRSSAFTVHVDKLRLCLNPPHESWLSPVTGGDTSALGQTADMVEPVPDGIGNPDKFFVRETESPSPDVEPCDDSPSDNRPTGDSATNVPNVIRTPRPTKDDRDTWTVTGTEERRDNEAQPRPQRVRRRPARYED